MIVVVGVTTSRRHDDGDHDDGDHGVTVGERRKGNKKFPTRTKTYHGDVHLREGMSDLRTLVDRTAEAIRDRG